MKNLSTAAFLLLTCAAVAAQGKGPNTTIPVQKDPNRHEEFLKVTKAGNIDLLFVGDSITDGWRGGGAKAIWDKNFGAYKPANFGISGDRTEHVIWRMRNGELDGISPKLVVIMIGTNNGGDSAPDVALGIKTIIMDIHERVPKAKFLLLAIFPRAEKATDPARVKNEEVNKLIAKYPGDLSLGRVSYLDINPKFLTADGTLSKDIMPDLLHPNDKGYQIWADAIVDKVKQLMTEDSGKPMPSFSPPSTVAKVAKIEETIAAGKFDAGVKALEKLKEDKDAKTADAAKATLAEIDAWKASVDAEVARLKEAGDVVLAADICTAMGTTYTGDAGKAYKDQAEELKKDPAYKVGKEYQKLQAHPAELRKDPKFVKLVEAFLKKNPEGYYAKAAQALIAK